MQVNSPFPEEPGIIKTKSVKVGYAIFNTECNGWFDGIFPSRTQAENEILSVMPTLPPHLVIFEIWK